MLVSSAVQADWTVHTVSDHLTREGLNNINPGLGYDVNKNFRIGGFYNSYEEPSFYAAGIANITDKFRIGAGIISGYQLKNGLAVEGSNSSIIPLVAMEYDITSDISAILIGDVLNVVFKF